MKKILQFAVMAIFFLSVHGCLESTIDYTGLLTLISNKLITPNVRGTVNNTFIKNIITVYTVSDHSIVATAQTDSYGRWTLSVPPGDYNLQLYSANPMIVLDPLSPKALYQISQYELTVGPDGKSMVKGVNLGQSDIFLTPVQSGRTMSVSTDNPQYLLYSRLMQGSYVALIYGAGITDIYALFSYGANNRVSNMREYLGINSTTGTLYSDTTITYNATGSIAGMVFENHVTSNNNNTVFTYAADGMRILNSITRDGLTVGAGTNISQVTYTYDSSNRPTEVKQEDWVDPVWTTVQSLVYTWNTDNTIDELTTTTSTSDYNFYFTYTGGNVTQLDINDKISSPDIHATYTLNTDKLPSGSEYSTGDYDTSTWVLAGTGTYTYEPTFGLLTNSTLGSIATYDMTYDSRGKQLSFSQDKSGIIYDYYTVVTYDSNGNISTADYYGEIPIVPPADLTVAFTWQAL